MRRWMHAAGSHASAVPCVASRRAAGKAPGLLSSRPYPGSLAGSTRTMFFQPSDRPIMVLSGTDDKYSRDADQVVAKVAGDFITELRADRGHALDQDRFDAIVEWIVHRVS